LRTPKHTIFPCLNHSSDGLGPSEYFPDTKTHDLSISYQVHNFYVYKEKARIGGHLQRKKTHLQQKQEHLSDNPAFNSREKRNYLYMTTKLFKRKKKSKKKHTYILAFGWAGEIEWFSWCFEGCAKKRCCSRRVKREMEMMGVKRQRDLWLKNCHCWLSYAYASASRRKATVNGT